MHRQIRLAGRFGIRVKQIRKIRQGIYRVDTRAGMRYCLKQMPMVQSRLRWIDRALRIVRAQGFGRIAWRHPERPEGKRLCIISQDATFVLTPWFAGRHPHTRSLADMRACGAALARFHAAGRAVSSRGGHAAGNRTGVWLSELRERRRELQRNLAPTRRRKFGAGISHLLRQHGPELLHYAVLAEKMLRTGSYRALRYTSRSNATLCHGDGGPSNFLLGAGGTYLLDFETLHVNLRAYDLYRLIYNSCKDSGWRFSTAQAILDGYRQVTALRRHDYELMKPWLRFPRTTGLVLAPGERIPTTKGRLQWALASERKISRFLRRLDRYAAKHSR